MKKFALVLLVLVCMLGLVSTAEAGWRAKNVQKIVVQPQPVVVAQNHHHAAPQAVFVAPVLTPAAIVLPSAPLTFVQPQSFFVQPFFAPAPFVVPGK